MKREIQIKPLVNFDGVLDPEERQRILNRIQSLFNWVGASIPEEEELEGKKIRLRRLVSDFITKPEVSEDDRENIKLLIKVLIKKEEDLERMIKAGSITDHKAMELLEEITGILRAVDKLRNLTEEEQEEIASDKEDLMGKIDDEKRWLKFMRTMK